MLSLQDKSLVILSKPAEGRSLADPYQLAICHLPASARKASRASPPVTVKRA